MQRTLRGRWRVVLPNHRRGIMCETLDDARRVAYLAVAHTRPCELVVRHAYHRVIHRELIDGHQPQPADAQPPPEMAVGAAGGGAARPHADAPAPASAPGRPSAQEPSLTVQRSQVPPIHEGGQ